MSDHHVSLELDGDRVVSVGAASDSSTLQASHRRTVALEYALTEIIALSRDNRITQIALRAIDARRLV